MEYLKNVSFIKSVFDKKNIIDDSIPIIAMVGKSNVGKSSLINALANNKSIAKVGNTPGKTKCINYFDVNRKMYIVDLPGYGYSTMSDAERDSINKLTNYFLEFNKNLHHIFFILDIRHVPTKEDKQMYDWLATCSIPFTIILNKADKLSKTKQEENLKLIEKYLLAKEKLVIFSSETKQSIDIVLDIANELNK